MSAYDTYCTYCPDHSGIVATHCITAVVVNGSSAGTEFQNYACDQHAEEYRGGPGVQQVGRLGGEWR